jgi:hypothetical protein
MDTTGPPVYQSQLLQPVPAAFVPPVSADGGPWDKPPSGASVLPAPCGSPAAKLYSGSPEVALMQAVLEDALVCVFGQYESERRRVQREAREAEEWLFSDDPHRLFSYVSVCSVLGLEPESIRQQLLRCSPGHANTWQHSRAT